jgi:hypothetical protein
VHRDLDPRQAFQEGEEMPGRQDVEMDLDIDQASEQPALQRVLQGQHHRRETELEVDRGGELALAGELQDARGFVEVAAHRLLDQRDGAFGQGAKHIEMGSGRGGEIEHGVLDRGGFGEAGEDFQVPFPGLRFGPVAVEIEDARDRQFGPAIGGEMGVVDDAAGAHDDDRARRNRPRPGLTQI